MWKIFLLLSWICFNITVSAQNTGIEIFEITNAPGWPSVFAPSIPSNLEISEDSKFYWSFLDDRLGICTANGENDLKPCEGRVVDYTFRKAGPQRVRLSITNSGISSQDKITIDKTVEIPYEDQIFKVKRPEMRSVTDDWFERWIQALYKLKLLGIYDHFASIHEKLFEIGTTEEGGDRSAGHSSPSFLPWHRMSMKVIERCISVAADDMTMGLPYWDWTKGWKGMDKYFGGDGLDSNDDILADGPFCNDPNQERSKDCPKIWVIPESVSGPSNALKRSLNSDANFKFPTESSISKLLSIENYDSAPFNNEPTEGSFRNALEGWLSENNTEYGYNHNGVHRWIGGTMAKVESSFYDPLFLVHHSQVDRIFTQWQDKHGCSDGHGSATCYRPGKTDPDVNSNLVGAVEGVRAGQETFVLPGHMFGDKLYPWMIPNEILLTARRGYDFLEPGQKPARRISSAQWKRMLQSGQISAASQFSRGALNLFPLALFVAFLIL